MNGIIITITTLLGMNARLSERVGLAILLVVYGMIVDFLGKEVVIFFSVRSFSSFSCLNGWLSLLGQSATNHESTLGNLWRASRNFS